MMRTTARLVMLACFAALSAGLSLPGSAGEPFAWDALAQGEYIGPARVPHVPEYRLRVDDEIEFIYQPAGEVLGQSYQLEVGDVIRIESHIDAALTRDVAVQPDGTVDVLYLGPIRVVRRTVEEIAKDLNERYAKFYKVTDINVMRIKTQTRLEDLRAAALDRHGEGGSGLRVRITPEGTLSLPSIGAVPAQGLTLDEIRREVEARYREVVGGLEVTPILAHRAPRYLFVLGEVRCPGRYELKGPTTVMQSIALAGGTVPGASAGQVVVFRRGDDWRLLATKLDVRGALAGQCPSPADDIWLRDSDIVVLPKLSSHWCDDALGHLFGHGAYRENPDHCADCEPGRNSLIGEP